jgi:hypothetical protein
MTLALAPPRDPERERIWEETKEQDDAWAECEEFADRVHASSPGDDFDTYDPADALCREIVSPLPPVLDERWEPSQEPDFLRGGD